MRISNQGIFQPTPPGLDGFAVRVSQAIAHTGLSQAEFARQLGVSAGFVSDVVRGHKKPGAEFLHMMRSTFGISIDWLLTGEGTLSGEIGIDLDLLRTIQLQIAVVRSAVIDENTTAKALLLLIRDGRLQEAVKEPDINDFLNALAPPNADAELALALYNSQLWTPDPSAKRRNLLAAVIAHFETHKPIDKVAALSQKSRHASTVQINTGLFSKIAGRDFIER